MRDATDESTLTVFYDASCPLCRTEVVSLERDAEGWVLRDCSRDGFDDPHARGAGISAEAMMTAMHVREPGGRWLVGIDALARLYEDAGRRRTARLLRLRALRPLWDRAYRVVVNNRQRLSRLGVHRVLRVLLVSAGGNARAGSPGPSRSD